MPLSRFGRRHKHTFGREKEEWDGNFRKPPKPDSYYVSEKGICRWCGDKIIENDVHNTRKTWHEKCATQYMIIYQYIFSPPKTSISTNREILLKVSQKLLLSICV